MGRDWSLNMDYNTQDLSGIPADDAMVQLELKRKLAMADALRQQEMPQGQMVSGHYVAPSWTQQLAGLANKYIAGKTESEAMKQYGDYQTAQQTKISKLVDELQKGKQVEAPLDYNEAGNIPGMTQTTTQPYNQQEYMAKVLQTMPQLAPKMLETSLAQQFKEQTPIISHAGDIGRDRNGNIIFQNPAKEESIFGKINPSEYTQESLIKFNQTKNPADLVSSKVNNENSLYGKINPSEYTPASITKFSQTKNYADLIPNPKQITPYEQKTLALREKELNKPDKLKEVPPTQRGAYIGNNSSIAQIDSTIAKLDAAPDTWFGLKGGLGDAYMQRMYPESNDIRASIGGVSSIKRHDISGAAVSPSEDKKLAQYIPNPSDDKKAIRAKLVNFKNELMRSNQAIQGSYGNEYAPMGGSSDGWSITKVN